MQNTPRTTGAQDAIPRQEMARGPAIETNVQTTGTPMIEGQRGLRYEQPTAVEQNVNVVTPRDRVRWGPILAGLLSALTTFALLSILGAAIGATTLQANGGPADANANHYGTAAGIWGAVSALIAFFVGGYIAAKTAAVGGEGNGWINGAMVFLASLPLIIWLASQGAGNLFGALGTNLNDLRNIATNTYNDAAARQSAVDNAKNGLWWSLVSLLAGLVAAGLGGLVGHRNEREVWHNDIGTRA